MALHAVLAAAIEIGLPKPTLPIVTDKLVRAGVPWRQNAAVVVTHARQHVVTCYDPAHIAHDGVSFLIT